MKLNNTLQLHAYRVEKYARFGIMNHKEIDSLKPIVWLGNAKDNLKEFPKDVQRQMGNGLYMAQMGEKYVKAKPLKGFSGAGVLEIKSDYDGDTYRTVYTVTFKDAIYVLHAFQKKSKQGIATPQQDINLIKKRLQDAKQHYNETFNRRSP